MSNASTSSHNMNQQSLRSTFATKLQDLNEDCLLEIFSQPTLTLLDRCSIAETCKHFRFVVDRIIPKKMNFHVGEGIYSLDKVKYTRSEVGRIFCIFGPILLSISFFNETRRAELSVALVYLRDEYLRLLLGYHKIVKSPAQFDQLQVLEFTNIFIFDEQTQFEGLHSLVDLKVYDVDNCGTILGCFFPKLQRFRYKKDAVVMADSNNISSYQQSVHALSAFISRHKTLTTLDFKFHSPEACKIIILKAIGQNCKEFEKLTMFGGSMSDPSFQELKTIKSLRTLDLLDVWFEGLNFFSALTELRELTLRGCFLPQDMKQLGSLSQLTKLRIWAMYNRRIDVIELVSRLKHLEELELSTLNGRFQLNEKAYNEIVKIVDRRLQTLTIKIKIDFDVKNCRKSQNVKLVPL